jgi:hypothetical protein
MPKTFLTKTEKTKCKVILSLLVTSLMLQRVSTAVTDADNEQDLPAVRECTSMIDELLSDVEPDRRTVMVNRIQLQRMRLTKKVAKLDIAAALVGSLQYLTSGAIKTKPGTRLAFIVETFKQNLEVMEKTIPEHSVSAKEFKKELAKTIAAM